MNIKTSNFVQKFFYWSLTSVLITLPFPKYNLNSFAIILCFISWMFYSSFQQKKENLKKQIPLFFLLSSFFWLSLLGLLYTTNMSEGLKNLKQSLPFIVFPLVFLSINFKEKDYSTLLKYFSYSVIIASLFALFKAIYFYMNNFGNYFFYDQFEKVLDKHTTYFSLFLNIAITYFVYEIKKSSLKKKTFFIFVISFLLTMIYILSARISVLGLTIVFIIYTFQFLIKNNSSFIKSLLFLLICLSTLLIYLTPNFQKRFYSKLPNEEAISDIDSRLVHWEGVINRIEKENVIFGSGTGDGHIGLYQEYLKLNFKTGYLNEYNAHNQYLETTLFFGFFGLLLLMLLLFRSVRKCIKNKDYLGLSIILVFMVFMCTESILKRHSGIVVFSYIISIIMSKKNIKNEY